ncbi:DUF397 domain-containing protein [Pseudonocardia sp. HH130630-07]|uniref:DUF397 domain-containing protein n=1 Tax=Pseudonocardia sp. HH130630-07 TaxID=1690815 RepID=UPI000839B8B0|nr:DUF397 domain-containing protein [Pseudonocardia sp. HH130630-07]
MPTHTTDTGWFKSSRSNGGGDQCVECRIIDGVGVLVRDSKNRDAATLRFTPDEWSAFLHGAKAGEFDLPG